MLTILVSVLLAAMAFCTFVVLMACIAAARADNWEEQYWEELSLLKIKNEKVLLSEQLYPLAGGSEVEAQTEEREEQPERIVEAGDDEAGVAVESLIPSSTEIDARPGSAA